MEALRDFKTDFILSADGVKIGFRTIGAGPGLILVHGALQSSLNFTRLAKALSDDFTVYIPDRRGRGLSGAQSDDNCLLPYAGDVVALAHSTGTQNIFGLSSGAIIALQAAFDGACFKKIALFEPPIPVKGVSFEKLHRNYERAISKGNFGKAFVAIIKGTGDASLLSLLPAFVTAPAINRMMKAQIKNRTENKLLLQELVPTFRYDILIAKESEALITKAKSMPSEVLLLGGSKSRKHLKLALGQLEAALPHARRVEFEKSGHLAADNSGSPLKVARELIDFFH